MKNNFITLRSSAFKTYFPNNEPLDFTNLIIPALDLRSGDHEVALVGFHLIGGERNKSQQVLEYSSIQPHQVGDTFERSLRVLSVSSVQDPPAIGLLQYYPCVHELVDRICVKMVPLSGYTSVADVPILKADDPEVKTEILITLHIRRVD